MKLIITIASIDLGILYHSRGGGRHLKVGGVGGKAIVVCVSTEQLRGLGACSPRRFIEIRSLGQKSQLKNLLLLYC